MLTRQDVVAAVGSPVVRVYRMPTMLVPEKETICDYQTKTRYGTVVVYSSRSGGLPADLAERHLRKVREEGIPVEGIGDEAYLSHPDSITVLIGPDYFSVGTQFVHEGADSIVKTLARVAAQRILPNQ